MGSCICRPITDVTDNPIVSAHASVGLIASFNHHGQPKVNATRFGFLYVKEGELCHDFTMGSKLMCKICTRTWKLAHIKEITVVNGDLALPCRDVTIIPPLIPGIRIVLEDAAGKETTLVMALAYTTVANANRFSIALGQCVNTARGLR